VNGKMTWYCKVDFYADITYYNRFPELADMILRSGGELGTHIHHISTDPTQRAKLYQWAAERMKRIGYPVRAYSAGMGEIYDSDAKALLDAGYNVSRWTFAHLCHHMCNWENADMFPGYVNLEKYKRNDAADGLFCYPLGGDHRNNQEPKGNYQLHVREHIPLDRLKEITESGFENEEKLGKMPLLGAYFHTYDLCENPYPTSRILPCVIEKWETYIRWLTDNDVILVTDSEAKRIFDTEFKK